MEALIIGVVLLGLALFLMRLLGAWMLRINEIITLNKQILFELKKINAELIK